MPLGPPLRSCPWDHPRSCHLREKLLTALVWYLFCPKFHLVTWKLAPYPHTQPNPPPPPTTKQATWINNNTTELLLLSIYYWGNKSLNQNWPVFFSQFSLVLVFSRTVFAASDPDKWTKQKSKIMKHCRFYISWTQWFKKSFNTLDKIPESLWMKS